uniref:Uncharacterized protein n=1 Tax=Glossina pallidipes TaxID=7398 RepID=A0A1A9ZGB1_GLOPL
MKIELLEEIKEAEKKSNSFLSPSSVFASLLHEFSAISSNNASSSNKGDNAGSAGGEDARALNQSQQYFVQSMVRAQSAPAATMIAPPRYRFRDLILGDFSFNDDGESSLTIM